MWQADYFATCDDCGVVALMPGKTQKEAARSARDFGWLVTRRKLLCPKCWDAPAEPPADELLRLKHKKIPHVNVDEKLMKLLCAHRGRVVTYEEIKQEIPQLFPRNYLYTVISQLRRARYQIVTRPGIGYILDGAEKATA